MMVSGGQVILRVGTNSTLMYVICSLGNHCYLSSFSVKKKKKCLFLSYLSPTVILASAAKFLKLSARTYGELVSTCDYVEVHLSALSIAM